MVTHDKAPMDQLTAHLDRAWDLVARGDYAGAMRSAEKLVEIDAEAPEAHNVMGYIRAQEGRAEEALEHYERAIDLDESFVEAMLNAAEVYIHQLQEWDRGLEMVDSALEWIEEDEEVADASLLKVDALLGRGDREGARKVVEGLPKGPFENPAIAFSIGRARFETGDVRGSESWLRAALERDPRHADAYYYLGLVLQERGETRDAALAFLSSRDAELRGGGPPPLLSSERFEQRVRAALGRIGGAVAQVIEGALVIVGELPGAEVVAEGVDPRTPVLLDDLSPEGEAPRAGRVFVYQRNVERIAGRVTALDEELARALGDEIAHVFPDLVPVLGKPSEPPA